LLLRTAAVLPFLPPPALDSAARQLFGEPAILLHLGWSPLQIRIGDNERHRSPQGRQPESLPCHPETLRDALARVADTAWLQAQRAGVQALYERGLVRGRTYAVDGTGLGPRLRLVCLVCVSARRPVIVAWRLLAGDASEKGKEAAVTRSLMEQALELGGRGAIGLLLADALYADGPLLAWCKYVQGIDVLVPVPTDRDMHRDLEGLAAGGLLKFQRHSYVRRIQGHKQRRTLDLGAARGLTSWDSFVEAARQYGTEDPTLWACLIRPVEPTDPEDRPWTLVSTREWTDPVEAFREFAGGGTSKTMPTANCKRAGDWKPSGGAGNSPCNTPASPSPAWPSTRRRCFSVGWGNAPPCGASAACVGATDTTSGPVPP
jgi:hypothetical protein